MERHEYQGFTLIEILVAATIVAVLSVIGVTSYVSINKLSRDAKRKSDLEQVRSALEIYRSDQGYYPTGADKTFVALTALDNGSGNGPLVSTYLPSIPVDPKSTAAVPLNYWYTPLGTVAPFYRYCICTNLEKASDAKNDCLALGAPVIPACNYYLRNP